MNTKLTKKLTYKYLNIQLVHSCINCVVASFAVIYLKFKGFSSIEIGFILSLSAILSIIIQPLIASFADRTKKFTLRQICMFLVSLNGLLCFVMLTGGKIKALIFVLFITIHAIHITLSPLTNSLAVEIINKGFFINYGLARGMGSLAYAFMSIILGILIGRFNPNILMFLAVIFYLLEISILYFFTLHPNQTQHLNKSTSITLDNAHHTEADKNTKQESSNTLTFLIRHKRFTIFLIGIMLMYYSFSLINTYFINIFENVGGASRELGIGLAIAAALELPIMAIFSLLLKRFKCSSLIRFAAIFYLIKALITLFASNVAMLYLSQTMQFFNFGIFTPASLYYVSMIIPEQDSVKGQTMINVSTYGLASVLASITGGILQETVGIFNMLLIGTIVTGLGVLIVLWVTQDTGAPIKQEAK